MTFTDKGLLINCNNEGFIEGVQYFKLNSEIKDINGKLFIDFFIKSSIGKALEFLVEIKKCSATFGWELIMKPEYSEETLFFGGAEIEGGVIIFGSTINIDLTKFLTNLTQINNEQINKIRFLEKEISLSKGPIKNTDSYYFDELSRLNNELVSTQRELARKNMELIKLSDIKNQFLGMAAHDLRNPLGYIYNFSEFIEEEKSNLSEEQIEFLGQIKSISGYMLNLVNNLLDISAIEAGKINLNMDSGDLVPLINKTIQLNSITAQKKNIKIFFNSDIESLILNMDNGKIEQVITNLLSNAIKYSNKKSEVNIGLVIKEKDAIISIRDNGQGIKENELEYLFNAFQKSSTKSTAGEKSTGLGLFIVKKIVEAHKGVIWAESEINKGSNFCFSIPIINISQK